MSYTLSSTLNNAFLYDNVGAATTLHMEITIPTSGTLGFDASRNGVTYQTKRVWDVASSAFVTSTTTSGEYIVDINADRIFRITTTVAGSANGSITVISSNQPSFKRDLNPAFVLSGGATVFSTAIRGDTDCMYDIGTLSIRWNNFYMCGDQTIGGDIVFDNATNDLTLTCTDQTTSAPTVTIPDLTGTSGDLVVSNASQTLTNKIFGDSVLPSTHNMYDLGSTGTRWKVLYLSDLLDTVSLVLNGVTITSTGTELNILDGVTSNATELNYLDGTTLGTAIASKVLAVDASKDLDMDSGGLFNLDQLGLGTTAVPHASVGIAMLALEGPDSNTAGPHIQITTATDNFPLLQIPAWAHDNIGIVFDAYYTGTVWQSSDVGSNYRLYKNGDQFLLTYDSGVAQGATVTWVTGLLADTSGNIDIPQHDASSTGLKLAGTVVTASAAELNILDGVTTNATELNYLDGTTLGTAIASKVLAVDANKDLDMDSGGVYNLDKLGVGTDTVPRSLVGMAIMALHGTDSSTAGPHIQVTTATNTFPLVQHFNWAHDNVGIAFDAYFDGTVWRSADAGSNFRLLKNGDQFLLSYDSGVTPAIGTVTWNSGLTLDTSGNIDVPQHDASSAGLTLGGTLVTSSAAELNILDGVTATATELNYLDGTTLGTAVASKVLAVDASKDLDMDSGGIVNMDRLAVGSTSVWMGNFHLEGTANSNTGPSVSVITSTDIYPIMTHINLTHDSVGFLFDAYYFSGIWRSSDAGSNFRIFKSSDKLSIAYDSGITAGNVISWNEGLTLDTSGNVGINRFSPDEICHIYGADPKLVIQDSEATSGSARPGIALTDSDVSDNPEFTWHIYMNNRDLRFADGNWSGGPPTSDSFYFTEDPRLGIGRSPTTNALEVNGDASKTVSGSWLANSDRRIKRDIQYLNPKESLEKITQLRPCQFRYTKDYLFDCDGHVKDRPYTGFIAQEFRQVFPHDVKKSADNIYGEDPEHKNQQRLEPVVQDILQMDPQSALITCVSAIQGLIEENKIIRQKLCEMERYFFQNDYTRTQDTYKPHAV